MNIGVLSHKLINCTHLRFIPGQTFVSPTPSSKVYRLDGPSMRDGTYFYRSWYQGFRVGRRSHMISTYISCGLMFVLVIYTLCGASALHSVELQRSLGDAAVRYSTLGSNIWFFQTVCDSSFKVIKSHDELIGFCMSSVFGTKESFRLF